MNYKLLAFLVILTGILSRLLPHHPNIVPITALCLFGSVYLPKRFIFLPLLALLISDYFIGFYGLTMLYVYSGFAITCLIGLWLKKHKTIKSLIGTTLLSSLLFFIITNLGVWAPPSNWYSHDLKGLIECFTLAIPFFRNSLIGDVGYTFLLFAGYEIIQSLSKRYLSQKLFQLLY